MRKRSPIVAEGMAWSPPAFIPEAALPALEAFEKSRRDLLGAESRLATAEGKLEETRREWRDYLDSRGWDESLCSFRAPSDPVDMGRVFGSEAGLLVWIDSDEVPALLAAHDEQVAAGAELAPLSPDESVVLCLSGVLRDEDGDPLPRYLIARGGRGEMPALLAWQGGVEIEAPEEAERVAGALAAVVVNAALFPVFVSSRKTPRYDGERKRRTPPSVVTIRLRPRINPDASEAEAREYRHRWEVRGHWRLQACGPNRSERRRIWVEPHVKGPDGAPMLEHEKLYVL